MEVDSKGVHAWDILAALPQAVVVADRSGRIIYANDAVEPVLGWDPRRLTGNSVTTLAPARLRGIHLTAFERYMKTGVANIMERSIEIVALHANGTEVEVTLTLSAATADGQPCVVSSLTPRSVPRASTHRDELGYQLDFTRAIMGSLGDGVYALDRRGRVTYINQAAQHMLGWSEEAILGRDMHETIHYRREDGTLVTRHDCPLIAVMDSGEIMHSADDIFIRRDGSTFPVAYTSAPIMTNGEIVGAALSFGDRTAEREVEREKEEFLSSVAHDLKSPLTSVKGFTQLLLRRTRRRGNLPPSQVIPDLERMEATVERVIGLVDELLDITRVRLGRSLDLIRRPADFVQIVNDVVDSVEPSAQRTFRVDADPPVVAGEWDLGRLQRMLANLLTNAVKYSPEGSQIDVVVRQDEHDVTVQIHNEGIGIPVTDLDRIFDQFHRGVNVQGQIPGAGIGLASARHVAEHHGGSISVESEEGQGATFIVRLPARLTSPDSSGSNVSTLSPGSGPVE